MHLTDVTKGAMGSYAIIGAHLPVAAGAAWSAQYRGTEQVAVCFFGDGTTNIGAFHEALNFSAVWKLPVIFVCENNLYMEYTPIHTVTAVKIRADRAAAYGLESSSSTATTPTSLSYRDEIHRTRTQGRRAGADRSPDLPPQRSFARRPRKYRPKASSTNGWSAIRFKVYREGCSGSVLRRARSMTSRPSRCASRCRKPPRPRLRRCRP